MCLDCLVAGYIGRKMAKKRQITEEQRKELQARMAHARANNPINNPAIREQQPKTIVLDGDETGVGLSPHLRQYLGSNESIQDFKRLRKQSPKDALVIAMERVWGAKSGGNGKKPQSIGVLVKVLTGHIPIPDRDSLPQHIVLDKQIPSEHNDTPKPEIIDISVNNHNDE